jgi:hypothetical protein
MMNSRMIFSQCTQHVTSTCNAADHTRVIFDLHGLFSRGGMQGCNAESGTKVKVGSPTSESVTRPASLVNNNIGQEHRPSYASKRAKSCEHHHRESRCPTIQLQANGETQCG